MSDPVPLDDAACQVLRISLLFLYVQELRDLAIRLDLSPRGAKMALILRIVHFLKTGERLTSTKIPDISCAKRGVFYPMALQALMLKGAYKNDLAARLFFKSHIGEYFHFTAFGIDWLNMRWLSGDPPTYQAFIQMWVSEFDRRQRQPVEAKEEWAYINFVQEFSSNVPHCTSTAILEAWQTERERNKGLVMALLASYL